MKECRLDMALAALAYFMTRHGRINRQEEKGCSYCVAQAVVHHLEILLSFREVQFSDVMVQTYSSLLNEWKLLAQPPENPAKPSQSQTFKRLTADTKAVYH